MVLLFVASLAVVVARGLGAALGRAWARSAPATGVHPLSLAAPSLTLVTAGAALAVATVALLPRVPWTWLSGTCACDAWGGLHVCPLHFDRVSGLLWLVTPLAGWALLSGGRALARQLAARRDLEHLTRDARAWPDAPQYGLPLRAIDAGGAPEAFVAGLLRPALYVDPSWWSSLAPRERAVIAAHEQAHLHAGDLVTHTWLDVALAILAPRARRQILADWSVATEVRADQHAVAVDGDPLFVADVLCRFARASSRRGALAPAFGEQAVVARVEALLGDAPAPVRPLGAAAKTAVALGVALSGHLLHRAFELALPLL